jgi:NADH-quinone oxidoreductase subunit M
MFYMSLTNLPLLSVIIWLPIVGGLLLLSVGAKVSQCTVKGVAILLTAITFGLTIIMAAAFDANNPAMQLQELHAWLPSLHINYALGVDGFAVPLILLTAFMTFIVTIAAIKSVTTLTSRYLGTFLIMQGLMSGVFMALDAVLFYIFFESMLIPMFLIIGIWGGANRVYATIKFFLYTFLGSIFLLIAILYLNYKAIGAGFAETSFAIQTFAKLSSSLSLPTQQLLFAAFLISFAVKIPMWPVHTWLPDAHVEAPTGGSVILAAITLKMGGYGILRFLLPIAPQAAVQFSPYIIALSLIAIAYIGLVAIVQQDMKKLIAYSSISHMGFVTLGIFVALQLISKNGATHTAANMGLEGAMVQMISHGFISGALFLCVGVLYDRVHSRNISDYGGVVHSMPAFAALFMLFAMANAGLPGTSGFVGELLVILSAMHAKFWIAAIAATTLILGASYTLWMYKRVIFGAVPDFHSNDSHKSKVATLPDLYWNERLVLLLLAAAVLLFGIWPAPLINVTHAAVNTLVQHVAVGV